MFLKTNSIQEIVQHLSDSKVNLVLIGEKVSFSITDLINEATAHDKLITGGIFPMVLHDQTYSNDGIVIKKISTDYQPVLLKNVSDLSTPLELPPIGDDVQSCILLYDGFMKNIPRFLERLYEQYWNKVGYIGGGAGSLSLTQQPCVFTNEGFFQDSAVVLLTPREVSSGVKHGWNKIAGPFVANKTEGNSILELNWRPAMDVYKEVVEAQSGLSFDDHEFFDISKAYPFGIHRDGYEDIIRDPISIGEGGSINCVGHISQNVSLNIMQGNRESLIGAAIAASELAMREVSPLDIFVVDCISRVLYLEDQFEQELDAVKKSIGNLSVEGVLSIGEISSGKGGFLELYNKTIVVSAFH